MKRLSLAVRYFAVILVCVSLQNCQTQTQSNFVPSNIKFTGNNSNSPADVQPIQVYAWTPVDNAPANVTGFAWAWGDPTAPGTVSWVKSKLDALPSGQKTLFWAWGYEDFATDARDDCHDAQGNLTTYHCPWFDNGIATVRAKFKEFFTELKASGGEIDRLVLDYEGGFPTTWDAGFNSAAISADPRFQTQILPQFGTMTFNRNNGDELRWNDYANSVIADALNQIFFQTLQSLWPNARLSNYNFMNHSADYKVPDANGNRFYLFGNGAPVGTDQSPVLYGSLGQVTWNYSWTMPEGATSFPATPFNALLYDVNDLRAARLSGTAPVSPWIGFKSFSDTITTSEYDKGGDIYQEMLMHAALTGIDSFLYWNPHEPQFSPSDDATLVSTLNEINSLIGYKDRKTLVSNIVDWNANYILSGSIANGRRVWRLTPLPGTAVSMQWLNGNLHFDLGSNSIDFNRADLWEASSPASHSGYWILQDLSAPLPSSPSS